MVFKLSLCFLLVAYGVASAKSRELLPHQSYKLHHLANLFKHHHRVESRAGTCDWPDGVCVYKSDPCPPGQHECSLSCTDETTNKCCCQGCEAPWVGFESSCYLFPDTTATWSDAESACAKEGASLVSIKSQAEQDFVEENMKGRSWLGMSDAENEGHWVWLADGSDLTYTHWDWGEPNGETRENYGMIWEVGTWNDCQPGNPYCENLYYICKKSL